MNRPGEIHKNISPNEQAQRRTSMDVLSMASSLLENSSLLGVENNNTNNNKNTNNNDNNNDTMKETNSRSSSSSSSSSQQQHNRIGSDEFDFYQDYHDAIDCVIQCQSIIKTMQDEIIAKDARIRALEGKLIDMSLELASAKAIEDEHRLLKRKLETVSCIVGGGEANHNRNSSSNSSRRHHHGSPQHQHQLTIHNKEHQHPHPQHHPPPSTMSLSSMIFNYAPVRKAQRSSEACSHRPSSNGSSSCGSSDHEDATALRRRQPPAAVVVSNSSSNSNPISPIQSNAGAGKRQNNNNDPLKSSLANNSCPSFSSGPSNKRRGFRLSSLALNLRNSSWNLDATSGGGSGGLDDSNGSRSTQCTGNITEPDDSTTRNSGAACRPSALFSYCGYNSRRRSTNDDSVTTNNVRGKKLAKLDENNATTSSCSKSRSASSALDAIIDGSVVFPVSSTEMIASFMGSTTDFVNQRRDYARDYCYAPPQKLNQEWPDFK